MIKKAAIQQDGKIYCGHRHHEIIWDMAMVHKLPTPIDGEQGFVTALGDFVTREQAAKIAFDSGQIDFPVDRLLSEDLY